MNFILEIVSYGGKDALLYTVLA